MNVIDAFVWAGLVALLAAGPIGLVVAARLLMRRSHVHTFPDLFTPENPDVAQQERDIQFNTHVAYLHGHLDEALEIVAGWRDDG